MDSVAQITAIVAAVVSGLTAVGLLIKSIASYASGKTSRERQRNSDLLTQRMNSDERAEEALARADKADAVRRAVQNEADRLRRLLLDNGIDPGDEPPIARTQNTSTRKRRKPNE